jgi:biotin carboxylase
MTKQNLVKKKITAQEANLIEGLRRNPQMMERVQSILEIASAENGPLKTADEVEAMLIEEMRKLGHSTMSQWATTAEERVSTELQSQDPTVLSRKKKR